MKILSLTYYPVKSLGPIYTSEMHVHAEGPEWDREWMLVDEMGKFVTQREIPTLSLLRPFWREEKLWIKNGEESFPVPPCQIEQPATVWQETLPVAYSEGKEKSWFLKKFGQPLQFVQVAKARVPGHGIPVRFVDTLPLLVCNEASLTELNGLLPQPVGMERFRANVVVQGERAWSEDEWTALDHAELSFKREKPCTRCTIVNVAPATGQRLTEPLKTLASIRKFNGRVQFGVYFSVSQSGKLRVGDELIAKFA
jgi:uncharacterized protein YcbX